VTRFIDGPAAGTVLSLKRSPLFLRAVQDPLDGKWDALDQLDDAPRPGERIVVYRKTEDRGMVHLPSLRRVLRDGDVRAARTAAGAGGVRGHGAVAGVGGGGKSEGRKMTPEGA
jgi:hypothetical protein